MTQRLLPMLLLLLTAVVARADLDERRVYAFDVTLDGSPIGTHQFVVEELDSGQRVVSSAKFDVRVLFFNAFRYRHRSTEVWNGNCLERLDSETQVNKKRLAVAGQRSGSGFVVDAGDGSQPVSDCVMTFAYWNPAFLAEQQLLNPQDGRYLDVNIEQLPPQTIEVRGRAVNADVYRVTAEKMDLKLWYSEGNEWLALESLAKGGRVIRYELS